MRRKKAEKKPDCPYCGRELGLAECEGVEGYCCDKCAIFFEWDGEELVDNSEAMSDEDLERANFCHGGDLFDDD